uniref:Uncharacterized protein n=1 Tax=Rhizophora mucronata TaxID=61149 RepID=A0A2P2LEM1_RHIMU
MILEITCCLIVFGILGKPSLVGCLGTISIHLLLILLSKYHSKKNFASYVSLSQIWKRPSVIKLCLFASEVIDLRINETVSPKAL